MKPTSKAYGYGAITGILLSIALITRGLIFNYYYSFKPHFGLPSQDSICFAFVLISTLIWYKRLKGSEFRILPVTLHGFIAGIISQVLYYTFIIIYGGIMEIAADFIRTNLFLIGITLFITTITALITAYVLKRVLAAQAVRKN